MTNEDQKKIEILLDLFEHEGWTIFIEDQEALRESLINNAYLECEIDKDWQLRRGAISTLGGIVNYEATIKYVAEQDQEEDYATEDL